MHGITHYAKDTQYLQPEEELLLQETAQSRNHIRGPVLGPDEVLVPRSARILQRTADPTIINLLQQIRSFGVKSIVRDRAHVLLQQLAHKFETAQDKFGLIIGGYVEPWVGATSWLCDEVGE